MEQLKTLFRLIYFRLIGPNRTAKKLGVRFGKNCVFRSIYFGSEPYLIEMGDDVRTTRGVTFITHDSLSVIRKKYPEYRNADLFGKITVGNNVFIGMHSTILRGTVIEDNVIIGAGSVVKGRLKADSVYAGVPAKFICTLEQYIEKNKARYDYTKDLNPEEKERYLVAKYCDGAADDDR